jgi:hypothetical protein
LVVVRWEGLPPLILARGYCNAAFGATGHLYVCGGQTQANEDSIVLESIECFDVRAHKWRLLRGSERGGVGRVDMGLVFSLM